MNTPACHLSRLVKLFDTFSQQGFKSRLSFLEQRKCVQLWHLFYETFCRFTTRWTKMRLTFGLLSAVQP